MPDVPAYRDRRLRRLYRFVDRGVGLAKAVSEEHFPCGQFGIPQQYPPKLNVVAVRGALAAARCANKFFQLQKSLPGAIGINSAPFCFLLTKLAEAGHVAGIDRRCVMRGSQTVRKRALPLGSPHDSIDLIGTREVLDQAGEEIPVVWIIDAQRFHIPAVQIPFLNFLDVRQIGAEHVLHPADDLHAALFSRREHFGQNIEVAVVGSVSGLDDRVLVVLGMRRGEIAAMIVEIVLLLAVIGQRLPWNLPSGDASTVGEYRKKQRIHAGPFLKDVQHFLGAFIHKRNRSDLDADHFGGRGDGRMSQSWHGQSGTGCSGDLHEFTAIHVRVEHELLLLSLVAADIYFSGFDSR